MSETATIPATTEPEVAETAAAHVLATKLVEALRGLPHGKRFPYLQDVLDAASASDIEVTSLREALATRAFRQAGIIATTDSASSRDWLLKAPTCLSADAQSLAHSSQLEAFLRELAQAHGLATGLRGLVKLVDDKRLREPFREHLRSRIDAEVQADRELREAEKLAHQAHRDSSLMTNKLKKEEDKLAHKERRKAEREAERVANQAERAERRVQRQAELLRDKEQTARLKAEEAERNRLERLKAKETAAAMKLQAAEEAARLKVATKADAVAQKLQAKAEATSQKELAKAEAIRLREEERQRIIDHKQNEKERKIADRLAAKEQVKAERVSKKEGQLAEKQSLKEQALMSRRQVVGDAIGKLVATLESGPRTLGDALAAAGLSVEDAVLKELPSHPRWTSDLAFVGSAPTSRIKPTDLAAFCCRVQDQAELASSTQTLEYAWSQSVAAAAEHEAFTIAELAAAFRKSKEFASSFTAALVERIMTKSLPPEWSAISTSRGYLLMKSPASHLT